MDIPITGSYIFNNNSCFIDSMLIILYNSESFLNTILYKRPPTKRMYKRIYKQLLIDYCSLLKRQVITSNDIRHLLGTLDKNISSGDYYNPAATYSILADVLTSIQTKIPQVVIKREGNKLSFDKTSMSTQKRSTVCISDYMLVDRINDGESIPVLLWSKIKSPFIVFQNDMSPPILNLNSLAREKFMDIDIIKKRKLDHKILDNKYELFGVIILHGVRFGSEGGTHYTSIYKDRKINKWIFYDDASRQPQTIITDKVANLFIWSYNHQYKTLPYMLFYERSCNDE